MAKKDHFLRQLEKTAHLKQAVPHVDGPSEKTIEQLEVEQKRAEIEKTKAEAGYWEERRQSNLAAADAPQFGLASNQKRYGTRFVLPKGPRRKPWK